MYNANLDNDEWPGGQLASFRMQDKCKNDNFFSPKYLKY